MFLCVRRSHQGIRLFTNVKAARLTTSSRRLQSEELKEDAVPLTNDPIIKSMFLGVINPEIFVFPEIETNEELGEIEMMSDAVEKFMTEDVDSRKIDEEAHIPEETMKTAKALGLFGLQVPAEYGGLELNNTAYARVGEHTALDGGLAVTLAAHQSIGLKGILMAGTDAQKKKYLPKLASGEHIAAFCLTEPGSGSDAQSLQTRATLSEDGTHYLLNGNKVWISNGGIADVMTVFAKTESIAADGSVADKVTAFIVERAFGGVISGKPEDKMGIRGSNTCTVTFEDCPVPVENVVGGVGGGFKLAVNILNDGRYSMGGAGAGIIRNFLKGTVEQALTRKQFGCPIGEFQLIKEKLAKMATAAYAMESMAYLTAGLQDRYEKPDLALEAAAVKIFSSDAIWDAASESLQIFGGLGYTKDYPYERYIRDARIMKIFEGTNEILRLFIAGNAMQHAGKSLSNDLKKIKDPLNNMGFVMNKLLESSFSKAKGSNQQLDYSVHPTFKNVAKRLSQLTYEFSISVRELLSCHGKRIISEQVRLARCADIAIDLYAVSACISRASRSLSIGLRNCDHETDLAYAFTKAAFERIESNLAGISGECPNKPDEENDRIAAAIYEAGGYAAEHPLKKKS